MVTIDEKKIELFVVFQEKLALKMHDSDFRRDILEPLLLGGVTEEGLASVIDQIMEDDEVKEIASGLQVSDVKDELKILLKKLIERFSKFSAHQEEDSYIG